MTNIHSSNLNCNSPFKILSLDDLRRLDELGLLEDDPAPLPRPADFDAKFSERWNHVDTYLANILAGRDVLHNLIEHATALHEHYDPPMIGKMLAQFLKEAKISDEERRENLNKLPWIVNQHTNPKFKALIESIYAKAQPMKNAKAPIVPDDISAPLPILTKSEFLKDFVPPDYIVDGILQRRFVYSLTAKTGDGKTALALLLAQLVGSTSDNPALGSHGVEKGHVVYFVGENPDDIRMRLIGADSTRSDNAIKDHVTFIPGIFNIEEMSTTIAAAMQQRGGTDLVIVDTSAAYFLGQDENTNPQMGAHARMLRELTTLPGGPCVLVLCHPIKHATEQEHLLPRGGGAFLAEMDGNLTLWRHDDVLVDLYHTGKFRGPGFEPITFRLEKIITDKLVDKKGRHIPTVHLVPISEREEEERVQRLGEDEDKLLAALLKNPNLSLANLARACEWVAQNGEPNKTKVRRLLESLARVTPKMVTKVRGRRWVLTEEGKKSARDAALDGARK